MSEKAVTLERETANIVILGNFNPAIFHQSWFLANQLISSEDADSTEIKIIAPVISAMFVGKWLNLEVQEEKFSAGCVEPQNFKPMRDFVQGIFILLEHTPVKAIGLNFEMIFSLRSEEDRKIKIDNLYNNEKWLSIFDEPIFQSINIARGSTKEDILKLSILPASNVPYGIHLRYNFHKEPQSFSSVNVVDILDKQWEYHYQESKDIADKILRG